MNIRKNMAIDIGLIQVDKSVKFALKPIIHRARIDKSLICKGLHILCKFSSVKKFYTFVKWVYFV